MTETYPPRHKFPVKMSAAFLRSMALPCLVCDVQEIIPKRTKSGALHYKCKNHLSVFRYSNIDIEALKARKVSDGGSAKSGERKEAAAGSAPPPEATTRALLDRVSKL